MQVSLDDADLLVCELPSTLQAIADVAGLPAALALAKRYGGTEYLVSSLFPPDELIVLIGSEAANRLVKYFRGERLFIPRGVQAVRCVRNRKIRQEYDSGSVSAPALALKYQLTERQVRTILNSPTERNSQQPSLPLIF